MDTSQTLARLSLNIHEVNVKSTTSSDPGVQQMVHRDEISRGERTR